MAREITEVTAGGTTYYITYSELDIEGESDQLYWSTTYSNRGMNSLSTRFRLRDGEIVDAHNDYRRVSKYDLAEHLSSL